MQIDLKPCPFCNGSASYAYFVRSRNSTQQFVVCNDCGAESKLCDSREEAAAAWNNRPYDANVNGLRPCPFCGEKDYITHEELTIGRHYYQCGKCGASPAMLRTRSTEEAAEAWNGGFENG